jgi:hypothetical protein
VGIVSKGWNANGAGTSSQAAGVAGQIPNECRAEPVPFIFYDQERLSGAGVDSERSNSRCGWLLYPAFAETFLAFRRIDFTARLRWLLDLLQARAIAGGANNFGQTFTRSFHRDQSLKQNKNWMHLGEDSGWSLERNESRLLT